MRLVDSVLGLGPLLIPIIAILVGGAISITAMVRRGGRVDLLDIILEPLPEAAIVVFSEVFVGGLVESRCKVQTLFGNDVW